MIERLHKFENLHILLWLCKDISWCLEWKTFGVIMIAPTITLAVLITWITRKTRSDKFHNLAVCCWIAANSIWMFGEFYGFDELRGVAKYFFITGIAFIIWYYVSEFMANYKIKKTDN